MKTVAKRFVRPMDQTANDAVRSLIVDLVERTITFNGEAVRVYELPKSAWFWAKEIVIKSPSLFEFYRETELGEIEKEEPVGAGKIRDQEIGAAIREASKAKTGAVVIKASFVEAITGKSVIVAPDDWFVYDRAKKTLALRKGGVLKATINGEAGIKTADEKDALRIIAIIVAATGMEFHRRDRLDEIFFEVKAKENKEEARKPSEAPQVLKKKAGKIKPNEAVKKKGGKMPAPKKRLGKKK